MEYNRSRFGQVGAREQSNAAAYDLGLRAYMISVYNYMAIALAISGIVAFGVASSEAAVMAIFGSPLKWVVIFAPLVMVFMFSGMINKMSASTAQIFFWVYAAVMGLSLASIFIMYTIPSVARVFFITAAAFGGLSLYGYTVKKSLSGMGSFLFMGLIGVVIAGLVNLFLQSSALDFAISVVGVLVFAGLTAYDTQKIKHGYYLYAGGNQELVQKSAIMGALTLYLDFINLLIMMLRLFADRK